MFAYKTNAVHSTTKTWVSSKIVGLWKIFIRTTNKRFDPGNIELKSIANLLVRIITFVSDNQMIDWFEIKSSSDSGKIINHSNNFTIQAIVKWKRDRPRR